MSSGDSRPFALDPSDGRKEAHQLVPVLDSRRRLDARRHVDPERPDERQRFFDVFGRQTARHVFPNTLYALVVVGTLYIATAIRTEASLSFLGLGVPPPTPSWGNILSEGRQFIKCCPWITTFSGLAIMIAVLAFNVVGDALRDLLDPRLRGE